MFFILTSMFFTTMVCSDCCTVYPRYYSRFATLSCIAFRYGSGCDNSLLRQLEACTARHLTERKVAKFHAQNDLVALGRDRSLRHACR